MSETIELRVVDLGAHGLVLTNVTFVDGQSRKYDEDVWLLTAKTIDEMKELVAAVVLAIERPVLSDATDFPDQARADAFSAMFANTSDGPQPRRMIKPKG